GQANTPCAGVVGQTCTATGNVTGTWTRTSSGTFSVTATGPAGTAPLSTPAVFLPTTTAVESFACTPVPAAAPVTTTCNGTTVGNVLQNATVTVRFALAAGGTQGVTGAFVGPGPARRTSATASTAPPAASGPTRGQASGPCAALVGERCNVTGAVAGSGNKVASMRWNLTATAPTPAGVTAGTPFAVFTTTAGTEAFACAAVAAGATPATCAVTTVGDAFQGSSVAVVFPGTGGVALGTVTGPGRAQPNLPLLPPPPPPILPPPPPPLPLLPPPPPLLSPLAAPSAVAAAVPVIPQAAHPP